MCADEHRRQTKVLLRLVMFHRRLCLMNVAHWGIKKKQKNPSFVFLLYTLACILTKYKPVLSIKCCTAFSNIFLLIK